MYKQLAKELNSNQKKYISYILIAIVVIIFILFIFKDGNGDSKNDQNLWRIATVKAKKTTAAPELNLFGTIINPFTSRLKSTIETYVDKVHIREGDFVTKDQLLVQLDKAEIELTVRQKLAIAEEIDAKIKLETEKYEFNKKSLAAEKKQLELIEKNYERQKSLRSKNLNSEFNLDEAEIEKEKIKINYYQKQLEVESFEYKLAELNAQLEQAKADLNQDILDLKRTNVLAPFNGYISRLYVSPGTRVLTNETIVEIFDKNNLEVKVQIPEATMKILQQIIKDKTQINASTTIDNKNYILNFRNTTANQDTNTGGTDAFFTFHLDEKNNNIRTIGRTVNVKLELLRLDNVFIIPQVSLYHSDRVYIVKDNKLQQISVKYIGAINKNNQQMLIITSDKLNPDDDILASVLPAAIDGLTVKIVDKK